MAKFALALLGLSLFMWVGDWVYSLATNWLALRR